MKFTSIFFTASASIFEIYLNNTNKRARNMKFTSIFFTASASIFEIYLNDTVIYQVVGLHEALARCSRPLRVFRPQSSLS